MPDMPELSSLPFLLEPKYVVYGRPIPHCFVPSISTPCDVQARKPGPGSSSQYSVYLTASDSSTLDPNSAPFSPFGEVETGSGFAVTPAPPPQRVRGLRWRRGLVFTRFGFTRAKMHEHFEP